MEHSDRGHDGRNSGNAAQESQQHRKRKIRDESTWEDIAAVMSESTSDRKVAPASDHFRFSSISAASQDIQQQNGNQSNTHATAENDVLLVQHILKLLLPSHNTSEVSFGGHKVWEDFAGQPPLQDTSSLAQEQQEQILAQLSSSSSALSSLLEALLSQQKQQQILADFLSSNSQQQQHRSQQQEQVNILAQLLSSLSHQQRQQQQQIEADRLNSLSHSLLQLFSQIARATSLRDTVPQSATNPVPQFPYYSGFTSDPLQSLLASISQQPSNNPTIDPQSLLIALMNALPLSTSSETTTTSSMGQDAESGTLPLATPNDSDRKLSDYQVLLRQQLEFFVAQHSDVDSSTQGRRKQVQLGQVGLRCRHCAHLPLRSRERGAVYYPAKLENVYQAAQNMASTHLMESCKSIGTSIRRELQELRDRKHTAMGGKIQWAEACQEMGLYEAEESGLRLSTPSSYSSS